MANNNILVSTIDQNSKIIMIVKSICLKILHKYCTHSFVSESVLLFLLFV